MGAAGEFLCAHLQFNFGVGDQVEIPQWMFIRTTVGCNQQEMITITTIDQGGTAKLARFTAARGQQQRSLPAPLMTLRSVTFYIFLDMLSHPAYRAVEDLFFGRHDFPQTLYEEVV